MVLIEAMAAGHPAVIASNIAGYSDVVTDGVDGILVPPADPQALAEELQRLWHEPERPRGDGRGRPRERRALRLAPRRGRGRPTSTSARSSASRARRARGGRRAPHRPSPPRRRTRAARRAHAHARPRARAGGEPPPRAPPLALGVAALLGLGLTALAANRIGVDQVATSIVAPTSPGCWSPSR